jgi:hypothetical protein
MILALLILAQIAAPTGLKAWSSDVHVVLLSDLPRIEANWPGATPDQKVICTWDLIEVDYFTGFPVMVPAGSDSFWQEGCYSAEGQGLALSVDQGLAVWFEGQ